MQVLQYLRKRFGLHKCICGAKTDKDHVGNCHFGWHNPETCPEIIRKR